MPNSKNTILGSSALFLTASMYGFQNFASRIAGSSYGSFTQFWFRCLIAVLLLAGFIKWKKVSKEDWKWLLLRSLGNVGASVGLYYAVNVIPLGVASFSFYAAMILFGSGLGLIIYKEKFDLIKITSLLLAIVGMYLLFKETMIGGKLNSGIIISVLAGFAVTVWSIFSRPVSEKYPLPQLVWIDNFFSLLLSFSIAFLVKESLPTLVLDKSTMFLAIVGITQIFTGQLVAYGFQKVNAQLGSILLATNVLISTILGYIAFGETLNTYTVFGALCISLAVIVPNVAVIRMND